METEVEEQKKAEGIQIEETKTYIHDPTEPDKTVYVGKNYLYCKRRNLLFVNEK